MAALSASFLPRLQVPTLFTTSRWALLQGQTPVERWAPALSAALPGLSISFPGLLEGIWEGILRAVPKNKVSHSRKRHRQMSGKALKDVTELVNCPGCGRTKRSHRICSHCLEDMKRMWKQDYPQDKPLGPPE